MSKGTFFHVSVRIFHGDSVCYLTLRLTYIPAPHWLSTSPVSRLIVMMTSDVIDSKTGFNLLSSPNELN